MADQVTAEHWLPIAGWPYEVSDHGRLRRAVLYNSSKPGGILRTNPNPQTGYPRVTLSTKDKKLSIDVHRLVASAFLGPAPSNRHLVAHGDGDKTNNNIANLRWATFEENEQDKELHGRRPKGELVFGAKLSESEVREIRDSVGSIHKIAPRFGIAASTVARIRNRTTWRHVQ